MTLGLFFAVFTLAVGLSAVATAARFAVQPRERLLGILRPLSASTAFAVVSAGLAGTAKALKIAADHPDAADATTRLIAGLAEAVVLGFVGFALLAVAWLLVAIGFRRQA